MTGRAAVLSGTNCDEKAREREMVFYCAVESEGEMHDPGRRKGRADHASSFPQMGCGLEWVRLEDFASSWTHGVRKVENDVSLTLLPRVEDFAGSWRHEESEGGRVLEPWETGISEVALYKGRGGRPWETQVVRFVST